MDAEEKEVKPKEEEKEVVDVETELSTAEKDKKEEANDEEKEEANDEEKEEVNDEEKKTEKNEMEAETEEKEEKAEANDTEKDEKEDLALLSETQTAPREERSLRDRQLDKQIRSQSEEAQAAFLQGAIPKVVFQHALAGGCVERV